MYSPSIFEKVGLGEAPTGVYVPEDSLLNILRNPSGQYSTQSVSRQEPPTLRAPQPAYSVANVYEDEMVEEEYQPPPPPPPPRRRTYSRSRPAAPLRRSQVSNSLFFRYKLFCSIFVVC